MWALAVAEDKDQMAHKRRKSMSDMPPLMQFYFDGQQQQGQRVMESLEEIMKGYKPNPDLSMSSMSQTTAASTPVTTEPKDTGFANFNNEELSNIDLNDFMVEF